MRTRLLTAVVGVLASLLVSAALSLYLNTLLVFAVVPFVPLLFRGLRGGEDQTESASEGGDVTVRRCPACGFASRDPTVRYCPRDGRPLESSAE